MSNVVELNRKRVTLSEKFRKPVADIGMGLGRAPVGLRGKGLMGSTPFVYGLSGPDL